MAVEVINEAARRRGIALEWVSAEGMGLDQSLRSQKVDLWPVVGVTEQRRRLFHLTDPWILNSFAYVERQTGDDWTAGPTEGRKVAFSGFPMATLLAQQHLKGARLQASPSRAAILEAVCTGAVDAGFEESSFVSFTLLNPPKACQGVPLKVNLVDGAVGEGAIGSTEDAATVADALRGEIRSMARDGFLSRSLARRASYSSSATRSVRELEREASASRLLALSLGGCMLVAIFLAWQIRRAAAGERAAQEADEAKSEFLANMSHEIRTPLHGLIGLLGMILESESSTPKRKNLLLAKNTAESLMHVANDILDLSKVEAGQLCVVPVEFHLRELMEALILTFRVRAEERGLNLRLMYAPQLPDHFTGDPSRVRQILTNLIGNALKFTDEGAIDVVVRGEINGPGVRIEVRDTGIGIPEAQQGKLFRKFSQLHNHDQTRRGGAGLGLAISRQIAELMGGTMGVASRKPRGSIFWLRLPLLPAPGPVKARNPHAEAVEAPGGKRGRILLAEDNYVSQLVLARSLQRLGYEVDVAQNGLEAVRRWKSSPDYDAILMDCQMPEMDGYEATRLIRQSTAARRVPIIALTAQAMAGDEARCLDAGMDLYMSKPFHIADLDQALRRFEIAAVEPNKRR